LALLIWTSDGGSEEEASAAKQLARQETAKQVCLSLAVEVASDVPA